MTSLNQLFPITGEPTLSPEAQLWNTAIEQAAKQAGANKAIANKIRKLKERSGCVSGIKNRGTR